MRRAGFRPAAAALLALVALPGAAYAKGGGDGGGGEGGGGKSCGGYTVSGFTNGAVLGTSRLKTTVQPSAIGPVLTVTGKYNTFEIDSATLGIRNYAFTGARACDDMTGGRRASVWTEKTPDHRGLVVNGTMVVQLSKESLNITRGGTGVTMKIQSKDCASGGIFQMEVERKDNSATRFTHVRPLGRPRRAPAVPTASRLKPELP